MLVIAILILLLASAKNYEVNKNYLADYVKFNRIVLLIFILSGYIAYNALDIEAYSNGIGIYGGVFKVTVLSQVFDIILLIVGGIVTILTCFVPYNFRKYDDSESIKYILDEEDKNNKILKWRTHYLFFKTSFREYYCTKLLKYYPYNDYSDKSKFQILFLKMIKKITELLPDIKINTPYLIENKFYSKKLEVKEYSLLLLYTVIGGSLLISSQNLISLYLSLELQSFTLYILSTSQIRSFRGTSGGLKYFLLGGLSSGFILLGCSLLYAYTGTLNLEDIFIIYSNSSSNYILDPCLLVLFVGLLFKVSAAPFHNWAPDVYNDVPTYSTTWLIIIAKLSVFILMLLLVHHIYTGLNLNVLSRFEENFSLLKDSSLIKDKEYFFSIWKPYYSSLGLWSNVLTLSALLSLIIGTLLGISQSRIKRLFAYSTISHVGFLLLALSLNSIVSVDAFIFYLIQYTITNLNLFFILVAWGYLYSRYYLDSNFVPLRFLNINPYSWKDIYIEPTLYDFFDSVRDELIEWDTHNRLFHLNKNIKVNTIYNYLLLHHNKDFYNFNTEDSEWLYTPVPFLTNFKGMHYTDPYLAFSLSVTLFSLAGIPPLIGFFAKQQVLLASMQADYYFVSAIAICASVISAAYYLRIIKFIYFYDDVFMPYYLSSIYKNKSDEKRIKGYSYNDKDKFTLWDQEKEYNLPMLPSNSLSLIIALLTNISLFYILKPYILMNAIYIMTIPLFQT